MEFKLEKKLKVKKYVVIAELARYKDRDDIISVLKLANEKGSKVTANQICDELLGGKPTRIGERIIQRCCELLLLTSDGELTQNGFAALSENRVPEPERGIYTIWFAEDNLISNTERIIRIEASQLSSRDEIFDENFEQNKKLIDLPFSLIAVSDFFVHGYYITVKKKS